MSEARFALKTSEICGILWHQGESDSHSSLHETYYEKLSLIIETLRKELNLQNVPLIIGGLGDFLGKKGFGKDLTEFQKINEELRRFAYEQDHCYFVTAEGFTANPDGIHLNAVSQRKFGYRYFDAYSKKCHILEPLPNENESLKVNTNYSKTELIYINMMNIAFGKITYDEFESQMSKVMQL